MLVVDLTESDEAPESDAPLTEEKHLIEVPLIDHEEAQNATDLAEIIKDRYSIDDDDFDILYNAFVCVFLRGKQIRKN